MIFSSTADNYNQHKIFQCIAKDDNLTGGGGEVVVSGGTPGSRAKTVFVAYYMIIDFTFHSNSQNDHSLPVRIGCRENVSVVHLEQRVQVSSLNQLQTNNQTLVYILESRSPVSTNCRQTTKH